jgi:hypothetical protein
LCTLVSQHQRELEQTLQREQDGCHREIALLESEKAQAEHREAQCQDKVARWHKVAEDQAAQHKQQV